MYRILLPFSWLYAGIMALRNWLFDKGILSQTSFDLPVISVGNLAVGGTGKTPHTEYLLQLLSREGHPCAMLSRGYGRQTHGFVEGRDKSPQEIGDEPWQIQRKFPDVRVCVCEKRVEGIRHLLERGPRPDVILLDDAFQHRYVQPGLSLLLTDYRRPYYQDHVLPAGRLRENRGGARRAHLIIITKCPEHLPEAERATIRRQIAPLPGQSVFFTHFAYGNCYAFEPERRCGTLCGKRVLLLCGIAQPQPLVAHLQPLCETLDTAFFPDHHDFTAAEIERLGERAAHYEVVVTTEKDAARLSGHSLPDTLSERLWVQPITIKFIHGESDKFNQIITNYVTENSRNSTVD